MSDKIKVTFREIIVDNINKIDLLGYKPYYSIRYREAGEENKGKAPSKIAPGSTIYEIIEELKIYI